MNCSVYWIRHKDHTDITKEGYVGVSTNVDARWGRHSKYSENKHLNNAIKKYGWDNLLKSVVIVADDNYCYGAEFKLRPTEQIGWNIAPGGNKPPVSKPRGEDYVSPLKGVSKQTPWMLGIVPWNKGKTNCWSEEQKNKFIAGVSKPHSKDHIAKRQASRKATRISKGQIKSVIINGTTYESAIMASKELSIPEPTIKYWCYGKGLPGKKYEHIKECRWA